MTSNAVDPRAAGAPVSDGPEFDVLPYVEGLGALLAGTANVIMQLARPGVGYGVLESKVDSGKVTLHPIKRGRTTFTYLSVATMGTTADRDAYRAAVNTSHRAVHSSPDSSVKYNAFDPELQLWVAACIHWGFVDVYTKLHGPLPEHELDRLYLHGARFGTTLQVKPEMWPADRAAFDEYWERGLEQVRIDPPVRDYLLGLMRLEHLPWIVRVTRAKASELLTTGFLPPQFRAEMGLSWSAQDQVSFERRLRTAAVLNRLLPGPIRRFPFNFFLWDVRRRIRTGSPLV